VAAEQVKALNPDMRILALTHKLSPETEGEMRNMNDAFWKKADLIVTALVRFVLAVLC
jgi:hypothetical protein